LRDEFVQPSWRSSATRLESMPTQDLHPGTILQQTVHERKRLFCNRVPGRENAALHRNFKSVTGRNRILVACPLMERGTFEELEQAFRSEGPAAAFDLLIRTALEAKDHRLLFGAR